MPVALFLGRTSQNSVNAKFAPEIPKGEVRRMLLLRTPMNKAASVSVYTGVGTFSELGKERMRFWDNRRAPKGSSMGSEFENSLPESMGNVCTSRNSASQHSDEYVFDPEGFG